MGTINSLLLLLGAVAIVTSVEAQSPPVATSGKETPTVKVMVASLKPGDLREYPELSKPLRQLIDTGLALTSKELGYHYGSCDPATGGMDCSGTVYHTLQALGLKPPRSSFDMYRWLVDKGVFHSAEGATRAEDPAFAQLQPGDLLFWQGTYDTSGRTPPISHVMIYFGTLKADGKPVVFGASSGRRYRGRAIHGVSVFDLGLPAAESKSRFVGYGPIPGLAKAKP